MAIYRVVALLVLLAGVSMGQQYGSEADYDYQDQAAAAPPQPRAIAQPQQRSYSRPAQQALRPTQPAAPKPLPIPILKQINRHNDDGSYTYGYEGADGSFKIETKLATGEVMGKYGYVDDTGKTRTVEYGANKYGFQPSGEGITVAPPTLVDETLLAKGDRAADYDDGQYYEEQAPFRQPAVKAPRPKRPKVVPQQHQQQYFENSYEQQRPQHYQPAPAARVSQSAGPEPPRAQIAGAVAAPSHDSGAYRPQAPAQRQFVAQPPPQRQYPAQPAPVHQHQPAAPAFHAQQQYQPAAPAFHAQQQYQPAAPRPQQAHTRSGAGSTGFFDQLTQDYALPRGGASTPLHDITFGLNLNY